ncbi:unnamed protein product [Rotaria socialis]|uniref:LRAT domain-containing protein n=1 Tax=Rotaria socialis TaxID=392032 RepID=A0A820Y2M4_9BILA|nr:unnamed protein product [Rotaria socialis]
MQKLKIFLLNLNVLENALFLIADGFNEAVINLERSTSNPTYRWSHKVDHKDLKRGDHIYAWRIGFTYQHHGIVIEKSDIPDKKYWTNPIPVIEDIMVIENTRSKPNMRIVTLSQFANNYCIRLVYYGMNRKRDVFLCDLKLRGKCYLEDALLPDAVVKNACFLYHSSGPQNGRVSASHEFKMGGYNLLMCNCEHVAFACSTDAELIKRCTEEKLQPAYESQQIMALWNTVGTTATIGMWHAMEKSIPWETLINQILPDTTGFSKHVLNAIQRGAACKQSFTSFIRVAGPAIGIIAASLCCFDIVTSIIRYVIYKVTKGAKRLAYLALGVAIKGVECIEKICESILSNGLATVFSLLGGTLGMSIPIPFLNLIVSALLSTVGLVIGRYVAGIPINIYRRYRCIQKKTRKNNTPPAIEQ